MSEPPRLLDKDRVAAEFGFRRHDVDRIFRQLDVIYLGDKSRKVYIRREDLEKLLDGCTYGKNQIRPTG